MNIEALIIFVAAIRALLGFAPVDARKEFELIAANPELNLYIRASRIGMVVLGNRAARIAVFNLYEDAIAQAKLNAASKPRPQDGPDYEGMILNRQEARMWAEGW